jgi:methylmalonyl-CoA/ethylmalonyl-CoA epimerase
VGRVLEVRELSFAVRDVDASIPKWKAMGFEPCPVWEEGQELIQARLTSMPVGGGSLSLMESTDEDSPINRFIDKRGEGIFSFTLLVDDIYEVTRQWRDAGVEFVLEEPIEVHGQLSAGEPVPLILGNWTKPKSLNGLVIELQDLRDENRRPLAQK